MDLVDQFTISSAELEELSGKLAPQVQYAFQRMQNSKAQGNQSNQQAPAQRPAPAQQQQSQPQKLTAESLRHHEDQEQKSRAATLQKNQDNNKPPAAPTAAHPPYPWGQVSPDGAAIKFGEDKVTRETLKFPANKRRKNNQSAANTPTQIVQTPPINQASPPKIESPVLAKVAQPPKMKCPVEGCKSKATFATQAEINKHITDAHPPKEETITDPLAYCLESLRIILNLNESGKSKPVEQKPTANIKQEAATPMSRNPTGPSTPGNTLLKTPLTNIKTPQSTAKSTPSKSVPHHQNNGIMNTTAPAETDPWANCLVTEEWFRTVFSPVRHLNHPVSPTFLSSYCIRQAKDDPTAPLNIIEREKVDKRAVNGGADVFGDELSPPTTGTGNRDPTPRSSDINLSDGLDVGLEFAASGDETWGLRFDEEEALADFEVEGEVEDCFEMLGREEGVGGVMVNVGQGLNGGKEGGMGVDPLLEMDWDTAFGVVDEKELDRLARRENADEVFLGQYNPGELERRREMERRARR